MANLVKTRMELVETKTPRAKIGCPPVVVLPLAVVAGRDLLPPWVFMWLLCFAIFAGLKWLTWWKARGRVLHSAWRSVAYLLAWPGMDAEVFLREGISEGRTFKYDGHRPPLQIQTPAWRAWLGAILKTTMGAALIWIVARRVPAHNPLLQGWVGMLGLILLLHFGSFELIAYFWQAIGVDAAPIMASPIRSTSLGEFWGKRWNLGFRQFSHDLIYRPLQRYLGTGSIVAVRDQACSNYDSVDSCDLRLRRLLCGKAAPFRCRETLNNLIRAAEGTAFAAARMRKNGEKMARKGGAFPQSSGRSPLIPHGRPSIWTGLVGDRRHSVAGFVVFLVSGLIHEAAISLPARGGYGLPTTYFVLQAIGVNVERSALGKRLGLRHGWRGWIFTAAFTLGPVFLLFHRPFVLRVMLPFLKAMGAL